MYGHMPPPHAPQNPYADQEALASSTSAHMYVSKAIAGAIIGKAGVRINEIRARTGCYIRVEPVSRRKKGRKRKGGSPAPDSQDEEEKSDGGDGDEDDRRLISVVGKTVESTQMAMFMLEERVKIENDKAAAAAASVLF